MRFFLISCTLFLAASFLSAASSNDKPIKDKQKSLLLLKTLQISELLNTDSGSETAVRALFTRDRSMTSEQRVALFMKLSPALNSEHVLRLIRHLRAKEYEMLDEQALMTLVWKHIDPIQYLMYTNYARHMLALSYHVASRILGDKSLHNRRTLAVIFYGLMVEEEGKEANGMFGKYQLPDKEMLAPFITVLKIVLNDATTFALFLHELNDILKRKKHFPLYNDYLSGRAYAIFSQKVFVDKSDCLLRSALFNILPRIFDDHMFLQAKRIMKLAPETAVILDKIHLLRYYNPYDPLDQISDADSEDHETSKVKEALLQSIEKACPEDFADLKVFARFVDSAKAVDAPHQAYSLTSLMDICKTDSDALNVLFRPDGEALLYGKRMLMAIVKASVNKPFSNAVFAHYATNYDNMDMVTLAEFVEICPEPEEFLSVCKHRVEDIPVIMVLIKRMQDKKVTSVAIVDRLLMSMIMKGPNMNEPLAPSPFIAPNPEYLLAMAKTELFQELAVVRLIIDRLQSLVNAKEETVRVLRRAYCCGLMIQVDSTELCLREGQQKGSVLLLKIFPFILSDTALEIVGQFKGPNDIQHDVTLIDLLKYHDPSTFRADRQWMPPKVCTFKVDQIAKVRGIKVPEYRRQILRSIVRSQPEQFKSIITSDKFMSSPNFNFPCFQAQLAQDHLSRALLCASVYGSEEEKDENVDFAYKTIMDTSLFDYHKAPSPMDLKILYGLDLDFENTLGGLAKQSDAEFMLVFGMILSCAKRPAVCKAMICAVLKTLDVQKLRLVARMTV